MTTIRSPFLRLLGALAVVLGVGTLAACVRTITRPDSLLEAEDEEPER